MFLALAVLALDSGLSPPQLISLVLISHLLGGWFFFSLPFSYVPSVSYLSPCCPCQLRFIHSFPLFLLISLPVSFFHAPACHFNANVVAVFWKCCAQELGRPSHTPHTAFCRLVPLKLTQVSGSAFHKGNKRTRYPWPNFTGLCEKSIGATMTFLAL